MGDCLMFGHNTDGHPLKLSVFNGYRMRYTFSIVYEWKGVFHCAENRDWNRDWNLHRILYFLYHFNREEILYATV